MKAIMGFFTNGIIMKKVNLNKICKMPQKSNTEIDS